MLQMAFTITYNSKAIAAYQNLDLLTSHFQLSSPQQFMVLFPPSLEQQLAASMME